MDTLYTSDGRSYFGMSQETVQSLLDDMNLKSTFVDKATYDAYVAEQQKPRIVDPALEQAKAVLKDTTARSDDRLNSLIKVLGL